MENDFQQLNEDKLEILIQKVVEWYALEDANNHLVGQRLSALGVEEQYHQMIRTKAHRRVQDATHRQGDIKLLIGIVLIFLAFFLFLISIEINFGKTWQIITGILIIGTYFIVTGIIQKRSI